MQTLSTGAGKPSIVLVHGAFEDGSVWRRVIPILARDGYSVTAAQLPLTSFAADVEATRRAIDGQDGPVVVVGHSYGGPVLTAAAAGRAGGKARAYIAAGIREAGEAVGAFAQAYPSPTPPPIKVDSAGFMYIDRAQLHAWWAADVSSEDAV